MAADVSIEEYLAALSRRWRHRHDRDELLDEVEDHLRTRTEQAVAGGVPPAVAEGNTITMFGDADAIADAVAEANGSPAIPTSFTRTAGAGALAAAAAWLAVPALWLWSARLDDTEDWAGTPQVVWMAGAACLVVASVLGLVLVLALDRRHGGIGRAGKLALTVGLIAMAVVVAVGWFVTGWTVLLSIVWASMALTMARRRVAPLAPSIAIGIAWPMSLLTTAGLRTAGYGSYDEWGDNVDAMLAGLIVGSALMAVGSAGLGWWLFREEAVSLPSDHRIAA